MTEQDTFLSANERETLQQIVQTADPEIEAQRAQALLAIDDGQSQAAAAAESGLTSGQLEYFLRKFREQRLDAFALTPSQVNAPSATVAEDEAAELRRLIDELNGLVQELHRLMPETSQKQAASSYSPQGLIILVRDSVSRLTPDMQLDILRNFQGMTAEDLTDIDTWKGMTYMMTYSARFQAEQVRDKVSGTINQVVPEPVQPGRLWRLVKSSVDRVTPEFAKQIVGTFKDATVEDLRDPDTWKGLWYMMSYSIQFQAEQLRDRLISAEESQSKP